MSADTEKRRFGFHLARDFNEMSPAPRIAHAVLYATSPIASLGRWK